MYRSVSRLSHLVVACSALALTGLCVGCDDPEPSDPCMGGICPERDAAARMDASGPPTDSGPPVDTGPPMDTGPGMDSGPGIDGGGGCIESWICGTWDTGGAGDAATRSCTDRNACGTTALRPPLTATLPALDFEYFECNIEPILDRGCSQLGCHGTEVGRALRVYHRGRHRISGETYIETGCLSRGTPVPSDRCEGSLECICAFGQTTPMEWQRNFDSARGFALDGSGAPLSDMTRSELLTQPLTGGGLPHAGIKFWGMSDSDYTTIRAWLEGARLGRTCNSRN